MKWHEADSAPSPEPSSQRTRRSDEDYWKNVLHDFRYFELLPDHVRPPVHTHNTDHVSLSLDTATDTGLMALARHGHCSVHDTALAALFALLYRYSGEPDIAIGDEISCRGWGASSDAAGPPSTSIIRRGDLSGDPTFTELLTRTSRLVEDASPHLGIGINRLIARLKTQPDPSRNPLFSVNFSLIEASERNAHHGAFKLIDVAPCCSYTLYDLNFALRALPGGWRMSCEYNSDLFEAATAHRLLQHFANLLRAAAADPGQPISTLPMLDEAERHRLIIECNQSATAYPKAETTPALIEAQVRRTPDATAVACGEQSLSYRVLDAAANHLAHELRSRGIGRTMRVGVCIDRSLDLVVALLAVLKCGAAYVPIDPAYPATRLAQIFEDAQPTAILSHSRSRDRLPPHNATRIELDVERAAINRRPDTPLELSAQPDDLAYIIYTSGSTGRPKGVQIRHSGLTNLLCSMRTQPGITRKDTLVSVTTISFDIAALEVFLPLIAGAKLVVAQDSETADGSALWHLLRQHHATLMQATPVTWQILLATGWRPNASLKMLCGGEALARHLADQLLQNGGELWNLYGPTETTIWSSALRVTHGTGPVPIGPPIANTQFYVLDANGQLAPTGAPGELYIGGDGVAQGYMNLPEMSGQRFIADPFRNSPGARLYRTGDLVRRRRQGFIEFLGRADHQVKLRGFRIELGEIESALQAQPEVSDCVAIVGPDAAGESAIRAYIVTQAPHHEPFLPKRLQIRLRHILPIYMCPAIIIELEALPRTPNGKIDRAALPLRSPLQDVPASGSRLRQTGNPLEQRLAQLWCSVLGVPTVTVDANFFEIGGHSLLAVRLLTRIESEFGHRLSLTLLFENPTIAQQAVVLASENTRAYDFRQVLELQAGGSRPPLIALNNTGSYYALSKRLGPDQPFISLQLFDPSRPPASLPRTLEDIAAGYVQLIRQVQPTGPYRLLGWCVAGTLAFEVAQQLKAEGQQVSQLILFDTWIPQYLNRLPWLKRVLADYSFRWTHIAEDWRRLESSHHRMIEFFANRNIVKNLLRVFSRHSPVQVLGPQPANPASNLQQYDQWLLQHLEKAAGSYEPKRYAGAMTLFRNVRGPHGYFLDPEMGWGTFVEGEINLTVVAGDHFSVFQEPFVSQVARCIETS